ncbi:SEL1-like repeat protein, partial [uncultured Desulfovibrio sp.]|uniref:SEL1-like repeat protein n=1 Tax=uncultured Desulfovibrio sp. TaxID=167968 RepID=UPI00260B73F2
MPRKQPHPPFCPACGPAAPLRRLAAALGMGLVLAVLGLARPGPLLAAPSEPDEAAASAGQAAESGLPQEAREQAARYREAAEAGNAEAQFRMGMAYYWRDKAQAAKWYRKAAEQGHA